MKRASRFFSEAERREISAAIGEAERHTSGEIVPVVATASGRYDRGEDLFGLVVAVVALIVSWLWFQGIRALEGDWASGQALGMGLLPVVLIVVGGFLAGAVAATYFPALRLPFIPRGEMEEEVERGAEVAFHRFRIRKTAESTGILIYVSLYERMVRVVGDDAIDEKLTQDDWRAVCDLVTDGLRNNRGAGGLKDAIAKCGDLLGRHFPRQPDDRDELANELHIID